MTNVEYNFRDPFAAIERIQASDIHLIQEARLQTLQVEGGQYHLGSEMRTSGGKKYLWGPDANIRINQWQDYILRTRGKDDGFVVHYGQVDNFDDNLWTEFVAKHTIQTPLRDHSAFWLYNKIKSAGKKTAVILSGRLLADFLDWVEEKHLDLHHDVIFTTFEPFPQSKCGLLFKYFDDWCDYMRSWDGGLSYYRCSHGTYHTFDHMTIATAHPEGVVVTDLYNKAQNFIDYAPGDIVRLDEGYSECACGLWHRNFEAITWNSWRLRKANGSDTPIVASMQDVTNEYQIYQEQEGHAYLLSMKPWNDNAPDIAKRIEELGVEVHLAQGIFRRNSKVPFFFSRFMTSSHGGKIYSFIPHKDAIAVQDFPQI